MSSPSDDTLNERVSDSQDNSERQRDSPTDSSSDVQPNPPVNELVSQSAPVSTSENQPPVQQIAPSSSSIAYNDFLQWTQRHNIPTISRSTSGPDSESSTPTTEASSDNSNASSASSTIHLTFFTNDQSNNTTNTENGEGNTANGNTATENTATGNAPNGNAAAEGAQDPLPPPPPGVRALRRAVPPNLNDLRERVFQSMYIRMSVAYASSTTPLMRRTIEFFMLVKSLLLLTLLVTVHIYLYEQSPNCLPSNMTWNKDGILRLEIITDPSPSYSLDQSYLRENYLTKKYHLFANSYLVTQLSYLSEDSAQGSSEELNETTIKDTDAYLIGPDGEVLVISEVEQEALANETEAAEYSQSFEGMVSKMLSWLFNEDDAIRSNKKNTVPLNRNCTSFTNPLTSLPKDTCPVNGCQERVVNLHKEDEGIYYLSAEAYIMEYALDYGLLRLSSSTRKKLNVPVTLVVLDPNSHSCFEGTVGSLVFSRFVGYDDVLISAIKNLAERDGGKGYLRNVVTGDHYRFVSVWPWLGGSNYIGSAVVMMIFTLCVSMLLRYCHHQIFLFILHLLQAMEVTTSLSGFPAAPMLTIILALVGIEAIMSEFFRDTTTAFYIIVIVWLCDQYDSLVCTQPITRKHWIRFFYLYHFAFYAYHSRCNGQYSLLALITSWLFIQHSMVYFYHHYELPAILRSRTIQSRYQTQSVNVVFRRNNGGGRWSRFHSVLVDGNRGNIVSQDSVSNRTNVTATTATTTQSTASTIAPSSTSTTILSFTATTASTTTSPSLSTTASPSLSTATSPSLSTTTSPSLSTTTSPSLSTTTSPSLSTTTSPSLSTTTSPSLSTTTSPSLSTVTPSASVTASTSVKDSTSTAESTGGASTSNTPTTSSCESSNIEATSA